MFSVVYLIKFFVFFLEDSNQLNSALFSLLFVSLRFCISIVSGLEERERERVDLVNVWQVFGVLGFEKGQNYWELI